VQVGDGQSSPSPRPGRHLTVVLVDSGHP